MDTVLGLIGLVFYIAVTLQEPISDIVMVRQLAVAGATIAGYVILGLLALWIVASRNFRGWMAWVFSAVAIVSSLSWSWSA